MRLQFYGRNGVSLIPIRSLVPAPAALTKVAHRTGRVFAMGTRALRAAKTAYQRRGVAYFAYLVQGWFVPRAEYHLFFRTSHRTEILVRQIIPGLLITAAGLLFGLTGAIASGAAYGAALFAVRGIRISEKRQILQLLKGRLRAKSVDLTLSTDAFQHVAGENLPVAVSYDSEEHFLNQVISLYALSTQIRVPALRAIDESQRAISVDFVKGMPLYQVLPKLEGSERESILDNLETQMCRIHSIGITGLRSTFHSLILGRNSEVWFTDFSRSRFHNSFNTLAFRLERDRDRTAFNRLFGKSIMTEKSARVAIKRQATKLDEWYAPIDFGDGLTAGHFWSTDCGTGRWDFLNGRVLKSLFPGKRILDLGCNIGIMDILMLRAGAAEVIGLEYSARATETANLIKQIYEWKDQRKYNFTAHNANMLNVLSKDYGKFDIVTAYCSLYYVSEEKMAQIVRKAAELAPLMIVQTTLNEELREEKLKKSTVEFFVNLLQENGFPNVQIVAPRGYSRPLLIARRGRQIEKPDRQEQRSLELRIKQLV